MIQAALYLITVVTAVLAAVLDNHRLAWLAAAVFVLAFSWPVLVAAGH